MVRLIVGLLCAAALLAQTTAIKGGRSVEGAWDASGATATKPMKVDTSDPGTCAVGDFLFRSDLGQTKVCIATNTWTSAGSVSYVPTRTSGTVLTLPGISANTMGVASYTCPSAISAGATFTVSSGTGTLWVALRSDCTVAVRHNVVGSCSAGCTAVASSSGFDAADLPLYEWAVTSGSLASTGTSKLTPYRSQGLAAGTNISFATSNGVTTISSGSSFPPLTAASEMYEWEEFISGECTVNNNSNGKLGWSYSSNSGGESASCSSNLGANHPGVMTLTTGATNGNDASLRLQASAMTPSDTFTFRALIKLTTSTSVSATVSLAGSSDSFGLVTTDGCYFEKASGDTNWFVACRASTTASTRQDTGVAVGTDWIAFQIARTSGSNIEFRTATTIGGLSGATPLNVTTNIPTAVLRPKFAVITNTSASRAMAVDFADYRLTGMTR